MKNLLLVIMLLLTSYFSKAQIDASYQVATWQGFSETAVSYTWDDNSSKQLTVGKPIFDTYNFKSTFFIITNDIINWADFRTAADQGHEIASHTQTHTNFDNLNPTERAAELIGSQNAINTNIPNSNCVTMAYPYCAVGTDAQTEETYISARTCQQDIESSTPTNFMQVSSITCGTQGAIQTSQDFDNKVNEGLATNGWVVFLLHGIDNDGGWSPIEAPVLEAHLAYMNSHREDFWVATYGQAIKYIKERDAATLIELSNVDNVITVELSNDLGNDTIYNEALSIQREMPIDWLSVDVTQNGAVLESEIIEDAGNFYVRFDAVPNAGNITITGELPVNTQVVDASISSFNIFPNPAQGLTNLTFDLKTAGAISISIVDVSGRLIKTFEKKNYANGKHNISMNTNLWREQLVYCVISRDGMVLARRAITKF